MSKLEWSPSWSVGDDRLDREHQGLIALINRLAEPAIQESRDPQTWLTCIAEVVRYAENHFRFEEERMRQAHYPGLEAHRTGHLRFRTQVAQLSQAPAEDGPKSLTDLHAFLSAWLRSHVLEEDRRYVPYLGARTD